MKKSISKVFKATALVMALGLGSASFAADNAIVAIVDDGVILKSELNRGIELFKQQLQKNNQALPNDSVIKQRVLDQLILRQIQKNLVNRYGVKVSDEELNAALLNVAQQSGFKDLASFQKDVDSKSDKGYDRLRASMAEDLAINALTQQAVVSRIKVSDQDVENFLRSPAGQSTLGTEYHLLHLRVVGNDAQNVAEQVRKQLLATNNLNNISQQFSPSVVAGADLGWKKLSDIPADLAVRVSSLKAGEVSEEIVTQDGSVHLLKVLGSKIGTEQVIVPEYQTRHILIQPTTVISAEGSKYMIDNLSQRIKNGEDFATLAATFSTDTGSARDGGNLGWVAPGVMVPEFEAVMKTTPVGQVSQPFQTQFGWHILQVLDVRQADKSQEYQQNMARQILGDSQYETQLEDWLREIRSGAYIDIK